MEHKRNDHCNSELSEEQLNVLQEDVINPVDAEELAVFFKMYSDPTRLKILNVLFKQELCVCDISYLLEMTQSATSHQLAVLKRNRIIKSRRVKKNIFYSLNDAHIETIYDSAFEHIKE